MFYSTDIEMFPPTRRSMIKLRVSLNKSRIYGRAMDADDVILAASYFAVPQMIAINVQNIILS